MTSRADFATAVRRGRRAGRSRLVAHAVVGGRPVGDGAGDRVSLDGPARVGFVVGKVVGGSVVRHRVQRKLRHVVRERLAALPCGTLLVVRALPPAATATSADLATDLDAALRRLGLSTVDDRPVAVEEGAAPVDSSTVGVDGDVDGPMVSLPDGSA